MEPPSEPNVCDKWSETLRVYHDTSCELENELQSRHDLGLSEFEVLNAISGRCGGTAEKIRMKELETEMYLSQSALSRTITRLERAGLVERASCETDRRANYLRLTYAGRVRWEEAGPTHKAVLRKHLA